MDIIEKIKNSGLVGRGGAAFPTGIKWEAVKNAPGEKKYIICNASEGEPGVMKDGYILENYPEEVINGIKIALETFENSEAYIYLRKDYYNRYKRRLIKLIGKLPITLFCEPGGYLCGEESTLIESIEGNRFEPRNKPPFPTEKGLFGMPTLVNNLETFYAISKISKDEYKGSRFYSLSGDLKNPGVFEFSENKPIREILIETNNLPDKEFFVQVGGGASGKIKSQTVKTYKELHEKVGGAGSIIVFDREKTNPRELMKKWIDFYFQENCGKCVPCREGVYRIKELLNDIERGDYKVEKKSEDLRDILFILKETSFCPLGKSLEIPFQSLINAVDALNK